jgi:mRNA-degrading endonuclease RelE of RelBE toxin-antitoxin system
VSPGNHCRVQSAAGIGSSTDWLIRPPMADKLRLVLEFRETEIFTRAISDLLSDDEYAELPGALIVDPDVGDLIKESGGLRKLRWSQKRRGKGKRGGLRVIYYWHTAGSLIYMLLAYSKDERDDLSAAQRKVLTRLVKEEFK